MPRPGDLRAHLPRQHAHRADDLGVRHPGPLDPDIWRLERLIMPLKRDGVAPRLRS
jgi:hypothetical protein